MLSTTACFLAHQELRAASVRQGMDWVEVVEYHRFRKGMDSLKKASQCMNRNSRKLWGLVRIPQ